jgi:hypothetical protein
MPKSTLMVLSLLFVGGCKDNIVTVQPSPAVFRVDLQYQFFDDSVLVAVDSRMVFSGRVTTNNSLSLAKSISVDGSTGQHNVLVQVVDPYRGTQKDTTVSVTDTLTVAVILDERSRTLYFSLYPFLLPYR